MSNCCPLAATMTTVQATTCQFNLKEVHRVWIVREGFVVWDIAGAGAANVGGMVGVPTSDVPWTTLRTAINDTKVLTLPLFASEPKVTPGGEISSTGLSNRKNHVGFDPSEFSALFEGLNPAQEAQIHEIRCEGEPLEVYFVLHDKSIVGSISDVATPGTLTGFPLESSLILLGRSVNGFTENDKNEIQFQLKQNWSHTAYKVTPDATWNPLTY